MALSLDTMFEADAAESIARRRDDTALAVARQRDGAAFDMRALGAAIVNATITADDPTSFAGMNSAVRIPTTLDHPGIPAVK